MSIVLHVKSYAFKEDYVKSTLSVFGKSLVDLTKEEWNEDLKKMRDYIKNALKQAIPSADVYVDIMLNRALPKLQDVFNPNYPKYSKIINKFKAKQMGAFPVWSSNVESAFAEGGRFEQRVDETAVKFADRIVAVLRVVGGRPLGLGCAPKVMMWLSGDIRVKGLRNTTYDTVWDGEPTNVFDPSLPWVVRQTVIPTIMEGLYYAILYHKAGATTERDNWLNSYSTYFKNLLDKIIDSSKYTVDTAVLGYDPSEDNFYVEVQISTTS